MVMVVVEIAIIALICNGVNAHDAGDRELTQHELRKAAAMGIDLVQKLERQEAAIAQSPIAVQNESISQGLLFENLPTDFSVQQNYFASMILKGSEYLVNSHCLRHGIRREACRSVIRQSIPEDSSLLGLCEMGARAQKHSRRGVHMYRRLLPNNYHDGVHRYPHSVKGGELPNPRLVAERLFLQHQDETQDLSRSIAVAQWAQFIEQDLARTVQSTMKDGRPIECCDRFNRVAAPRSIHPSCRPIKVPRNDSFYGKIDVSCLNYVRSALAVDPECKFGPAEQLNQASSHLDLSQLYGVTEEERLSIRKFSHGKLKTQPDSFPEQLPRHPHNCHVGSSGFCFESGDPRVNSNPYSYALHTVFLRFHNQLASEIAKHSSKLRDEQIFQAARMANIHVYQKIIYEEWAPVVLGREKARIALNATTIEQKMVSNEFATVAIRFYNTMFPGDLMQAEKQLENNLLDMTELDPFAEQLFSLQDVQFKPRNVSLEKIMTAVTRHHAMAIDTGYVDDLSNQMYRAFQHPDDETLAFGSDSLALDIQRSRDHGLPGYAKYVERCSSHLVTAWGDLQGLVRPRDLQLFQQLYRSPADVDLLVGALAEMPSKDATVGPTLQCIIADQLASSRSSDPNFYDLHVGRAERSMTHVAARLLCETVKVTHVQGNIFLVPSPGNYLRSCRDFASEAGELKSFGS